MGACQHTSVDDVGLSAVLSASARSGRTRTHIWRHACACNARVSCVHPGLCHGTGMPSHERGGEWGALNELERHNTHLFLSGGTAQALKAGLSVNRGAFRSLEACFFFLSPDRVHVLCLWLTHKLFGVDRLQYQSQHIATRCAPMFLFERWSGE